MARQYRIEGVTITRWYDTPGEATDAYNRSRKCARLQSIHCPGEVCGDAFCGGAGYGTATHVTGVRDGHGLVVLQIRTAKGVHHV